MKRDNLVEAIRDTLVRYPAPYESHYGVVPPPPPLSPISLSGADGRRRTAMQALDRLKLVAAELKDPYVVSRVLTRREAVSSSAIEGTNSTLDELLTIEETDDVERGTAAQQVKDYAVALDRFIPKLHSRGPGDFTLDLILDLHREVMRHDRDYKDRPGDLRQRVVWIGGLDIGQSTFNPPPPDRVPEALEATLAYLRADGPHVQSQSIITRMAVAHAHFEAVHPFRDGNGRVGRLLLPLMLAAEDYVPLYLSPYIEANKRAYYDALAAAQQRLHWEGMIGFISSAIIGTDRELAITRRALGALEQHWAGSTRLRQGSAAQRALALLPHYPVVSIRRLASLLDVTFAAASNGVQQLVAAGILTERTGYARNRLFVARQALKIINRPFGVDPEEVDPEV
jgi:Fic family protein